MLNPLKINNLSNVATSLFIMPNKTKLQLANITSLSNTTVSDAINSMSRIRLVKVVGYEDSAGGRRSSVYAINEDYGQIIGIDIKKEYIDGVITNMHGDVIYHHRYMNDPEEKIINQLLDFINSLITDRSCHNPVAIGICLDGRIDYDNQIIIECEELNWHNVHLKEIIERRVSVPTYIDHFANGLIFLEIAKWKKTEGNNFVIFVGEKSVRSSIYLDNKILRGCGNFCGKNNGIDSRLAADIIEFLDIDHVICCSINGKKRISLNTDVSHQIKSVAVELMQGDVAAGIAIQAEALWFRSIYFLLG